MSISITIFNDMRQYNLIFINFFIYFLSIRKNKIIQLPMASLAPQENGFIRHFFDVININIFQ